MTSKRVKSHHPDMERALNPDEKTVTVPREVQFFTEYEGPSSQHPSAKLFSKPRYMPRQFKNLSSYFELAPEVAPKTVGEDCRKSCFSIDQHEFLNPMTPEDLLKNYYGEEDLPLGDEDDPPLHTYEKRGVTSDNEKNSLAGKPMITYLTDEPPPEYEANNAGRTKQKKNNRSGSGKKKSAKAKKKAAKAKKARAYKSSASATINNDNAKPPSAEESPSTSSAIEGHELVPQPPPPPYEELKPLTDILIKIRIYKPFEIEDNENGTSLIYQNVGPQTHNASDIREPFIPSGGSSSKNKVNKGILVMNNEFSDKKTTADDDADSFNKWYTASRLADSAKTNTYSWWPDHLACPEHFKFFPDAALDACYPPHLRFSYKYIQFDSKSIGATCGHLPGNVLPLCELCSKGVLCADEGYKTCQYNRRQYKGAEVRSY